MSHASHRRILFPAASPARHLPAVPAMPRPSLALLPAPGALAPATPVSR